MSKPVVFVIGASGNIGAATVSALSSKYRDAVEIRAGVRNPEKADNLKTLLGVKVVQASMGSPDLVDTVKGVDTLYIVTPGAEDRAHLTISTAELAKKAGVKHIAAVSVFTTSFADTVFGRQLSEVETNVSKLGVPYTFIRLPLFVDNLYGFKGSISSQGAVFSFIDPEKKFPQVTVEDAGKASAAILANPNKFVNKTVELTSDIHNYNGIIDEFSKALGKEVKYTQLPIDTAQATLEGMGWPGWQAKGVIELMALVNKEKFPRGDLGIYEAITGEKPMDIKTWINKHAAAFK